jgi:hypothetical protein
MSAEHTEKAVYHAKELIKLMDKEEWDKVDKVGVKPLVKLLGVMGNTVVKLAVKRAGQSKSTAVRDSRKAKQKAKQS